MSVKPSTSARSAGVAKSIVLARDIVMKKKSPYEGKEKNLTDNINEEDVRKARANC
ncbi:MAG: hypothetical protein ACTSP1_03865 [Candidatus Freyarchaeota archaeon]